MEAQKKDSPKGNYLMKQLRLCLLTKFIHNLNDNVLNTITLKKYTSYLKASFANTLL